jgi:hypothetical protein
VVPKTEKRPFLEDFFIKFESIAWSDKRCTCLSNAISLEVVEGIAKLKDELNPEIMRVVFKDSGFKDDVVKTNAVQILKQAGIIDVRSL